MNTPVKTAIHPVSLLCTHFPLQPCAIFHAHSYELGEGNPKARIESAAVVTSEGHCVRVQLRAGKPAIHHAHAHHPIRRLQVASSAPREKYPDAVVRFCLPNAGGRLGGVRGGDRPGRNPVARQSSQSASSRFSEKPCPWRVTKEETLY